VAADDPDNYWRLIVAHPNSEFGAPIVTACRCAITASTLLFPI